MGFAGSASILSLMTLLIALFGMLLVIIALIPVVLVLLVRAAARRVRRDPRWLRTTLTVQEKFSPPGPRRGVFALRARLNDAIGSARHAVAVLEAHGSVRGEMGRFVRELDRVAATLDAQLELMQSEPDPAILHDLLGPVRARVLEIEGTVRHIRSAAYAALSGDMDGTVAAITADVERELIALQAGVTTLRSLTMDDRTGMRPRARKEAYR